jgi:hypothetical protein
MNNLELWGLIGQIGLVLLVGGFVGWIFRRRPHLRDGRRESPPVTSSPVETAPRIRIPQPDDEENPNIIDGHFA